MDNLTPPSKKLKVEEDSPDSITPATATSDDFDPTIELEDARVESDRSKYSAGRDDDTLGSDKGR